MLSSPYLPVSLSGSIHHLLLVHLQILKHLPVKQIDIMLKMEIVPWVSHHTYLGKKWNFEHHLE